VGADLSTDIRPAVLPTGGNHFMARFDTHSAFFEVHLSSDAQQLKQTKPDERTLRSLHESSTTFFVNLAQSLVQHNLATTAQIKGDSRAANRYRREGITYERAALKVVMKFITAVFGSAGGAPQTYTRLDINEPRFERFQDRFPPFRSLDGKASIWDTWVEGTW
jgi:hypothetical protein